MEGLKFYRFIYFVVAMGLVRTGSRDHRNSSLGLNATVAYTQTGPATLDPSTASPAENSAPTGTNGTPGSTPSTSATGRAITPTTHSPVTPKSKVSAAKEEGIDQRGLLLIALGGTVFTCVMLLVTTVVLASKVCYLTGRLHSTRPTRTNADLLSGAGYWGSGRRGREVAGTGVAGTGVAEADVMLKEVKLVKDEEGTAEPGGAQEAADEAGNSGKGEAGPTKELNGVPTTAANPEPGASPTGVEVTPAPTSQPTSDVA